MPPSACRVNTFISRDSSKRFSLVHDSKSLIVWCCWLIVSWNWWCFWDSNSWTLFILDNRSERTFAVTAADVCASWLGNSKNVLLRLTTKTLLYAWMASFTFLLWYYLLEIPTQESKSINLFNTYFWAVTLLRGWLIHRLMDSDCCSYKLDLLWLDSMCNLWIFQHVVLLTYCNVSVDICIDLFIFSLWCFICILLFCMNLWGSDLNDSYGRRFLSLYSWWSTVFCACRNKLNGTKSIKSAKGLACWKRLTLWKKLGLRKTPDPETFKS